jgi:Uma2 family endonuclease
LQWDRSDKLRTYARAGLTTYWFVNVIDMQIEVFKQPAGSGYAIEQVYQHGDAVPLDLDGLLIGTIPAAELLP